VAGAVGGRNRPVARSVSIEGQMMKVEGQQVERENRGAAVGAEDGEGEVWGTGLGMWIG